MPSVPPSPLLKIVAAGATDIGRTRKHNEDAVLLRPDLHLYLLADGAGGHDAGNVASALATTSIAHSFETSQPEAETKPEFDEFGLPTGARRLARAIQKANRDIVDIAKASNRHRGMGSTVVAAAASPKSGLLHIAHVGDSRCYRLRGGVLEQLTHDHSLLNEVLETRPELDDTILTKLPRHVVTRALGMLDALRVAVRTFEILAGDKYVLCSDGLTDVLGPDEIIASLNLEKTPEEEVSLLIEMAKDAGSRDNIAVVVIEIGKLPEGPLLTPLPRPVPPPRKNKLSVPPPPNLGGDDDGPEIVILSEGHADVVPAPPAASALEKDLQSLVGPPRPAPKK